MKQTIKLNEEQLRKVVAESVKKGLKEYGGISLSDYDNPSVRYNRLDGDEMTALHQYDSHQDEINGESYPDISEEETILNTLLKIRKMGGITDDELDSIRDRLCI